MKNKRVLITGGEGFVGIHLTNYLLENSDYELYATFHIEHNNRIVNDRVKYIQFDLTNENDVLTVISKVKPDYIYHLAGISFVPLSFEKPKLTYETNLQGTLNIYEAIKKLDIRPSILFVSTSEVYGKILFDDIPVLEEKKLSPQNPYAASKAMGELLSYQYYKNYGLKIKIARPFNHIGVNQNIKFVVPSFASQIIEIVNGDAESIKVGNLEAIRDFLDVKDVVRAYKLLIESEYDGEIFNICSGKGIKIEEILSKLIKLSEVDIKIKPDPERMRPSENPLIKGSNIKIRDKLGWKPEISIEKTLRDVITSFQRNY